VTLLLVAARPPNSLFDCVEGELVYPGTCDCVDCARLFVGVTTGGHTPTARLADLPATRHDLAGIVTGYTSTWPDAPYDDDTINRLVDDLLWPGQQPHLHAGPLIIRDGDRLTMSGDG
jgi:hypothetical protein